MMDEPTGPAVGIGCTVKQAMKRLEIEVKTHTCTANMGRGVCMAYNGAGGPHGMKVLPDPRGPVYAAAWFPMGCACPGATCLCATSEKITLVNKVVDTQTIHAFTHPLWELRALSPAQWPAHTARCQRDTTLSHYMVQQSGTHHALMSHRICCSERTAVPLHTIGYTH